MIRPNFLERVEYGEGDTGKSHTFKPLTQGVVPEVYEISFTEPTGAGSAATIKLEFQDQLDDSDALSFPQIFVVGAGNSFDQSFETSHNQVKVTYTSPRVNGDNKVEVRCIAGPIAGGVNDKGFGTAVQV